MPDDWFTFKLFTIRQGRSAFRVGTDGVLLGAWADVGGVRTVLDIGTGNGLLALMLAQRSDARITGIEVDQGSCRDARENAGNSPWSERIRIVQTSLQDFNTMERYDMVISNPPYFRDSLISPDRGKAISKHDSMLSLEDLAVKIPQLLSDAGRTCLVLPVRESRLLEALISESGFLPHRVMDIKPVPDLPVKRRLMDFRQAKPQFVQRDELVIETGKRHDYTPEYRELTREFYLKF